jgi:hypothetical protein
MQLRPVLVGALAICIVIGGGTFAGLVSAPPATTASVVDLKMMDKNERALEQMDRLLQEDNDSGASADTSVNQ